ncbi:hypothetical protein Pgin01_00046 [Porphyromonas gingivalis]
MHIPQLSATQLQFYKFIKFSKKHHNGVLNPSFFLGLWFSLFCIMEICLVVISMKKLHEAYLYYIREPVCTTASVVEAFLDRQQELLSERLRSMKKHNCGSQKRWFEKKIKLEPKAKKSRA